MNLGTAERIGCMVGARKISGHNKVGSGDQSGTDMLTTDGRTVRPDSVLGLKHTNWEGKAVLSPGPYELKHVLHTFANINPDTVRLTGKVLICEIITRQHSRLTPRSIQYSRLQRLQ